jgi:asparagine synthase (glutamine-hydrolysing)
MSIQFGIVNLDGEPIDPQMFTQAQAVIAPYVHDLPILHVERNFGLLYLPTSHSKNEGVPANISAPGAICLWDGRLDNAADLARKLGEGLNANSPEHEIVLAAYERWRWGAFAALIGDWAVSLWDSPTQAVVLATDVLGARHLYYRIKGNRLAWSTLIDPLVRAEKGSLSLCAEYLAGCLGFLPATHLTPYTEIHAVPPASFLMFRHKQQKIQKYWHFDPAKSVRYRKDSEYEAHFLEVFGESVSRRLRSDAPVLAELSGGMDSSSIVCIADRLITSGTATTPRLDTISYYSAHEPDWDEQPYFSKVEEARGRAGQHIDLGCCGFFQFGVRSTSPAFVPDAFRDSEADKQITAYVRSAGYHVLLSGLGGDEVTGGVPTAIPELADLLTAGKLPVLARQLKAWALTQRKPWLHLLAETCRGFLPSMFWRPADGAPAPWLHPNFAKRYPAALHGYPTRLKLFGPLPSFQENLNTLEALRRRLAWSSLSPGRPWESRYPYLDRDLLEFLFAIPREQLVRPGQRRSLMRRALRNIVPDEVLHRKRKAFVSRAPRTAIRNEWDNLVRGNGAFVSASLGIVNPTQLVNALKETLRGKDLPLLPLVRAVSLEFWLRHVAELNVCSDLRARCGSAAGFLSWDTPITERR